jgi:hypothetical protein
MEAAMDFARAFSYVFEDQDWLKKVGIAGLVMLIPLIGQIVVMGWMVEITRRVINDEAQPLPAWDDFAGHAMRGLQGFAIGLVYALPVIFISGCGNVLLAMAGNAGSGDFGDALLGIATLLSFCVSCLSFIFSLALGLVMPAALGRFAATGQLGSAFQFAEVFGMVRSSIGPYLLVLVGAIASGFVGGLGAIACGIGLFFTMAYAFAVNGHFYGQAYKIANANANTAGATTL